MELEESLESYTRGVELLEERARPPCRRRAEGLGVLKDIDGNDELVAGTPADDSDALNL